ncbi:hypothetical protein F5B17DRAFT_377946 [Nemania serpens]|nr:hypothetical protein F5B17DRAFT_377946 [Nemania serpens]
MCIKSYQHFAKCDHVFTTLTTCPTYRKQQKSAEGLLGRLFQPGARKKKNCGRVFPHHLRNETYCQDCSIETGRFTAEGLGQGALRVRKQGFQEAHPKDRKEAARASLQNSRKSQPRAKDSNHNVIHVENSVWLDSLYNNPETLAKKEAYARAAAPAPPVSSHSRHPSGTRQHHGEYTREIGEERMPSYGGSQPTIRPAQPAQTYSYPVRIASNSSSLPPAVGPPPGPQTKGPKLRHMTGQVYNSSKIRNQRLTPPYQAYLDGMATEAAIRARHRPCSEPPQGPVVHKSCWEEEPSRWEAKKATLSSWIERNRERRATGDGSDVSFVCATSKAISNQAKDQSRSKRVTRGDRK